MAQIDVGMRRIRLAILVCATFLLASMVQAQSAPSAPRFDHAKTGFLLRDVHTTLRCEQCHVDGIFKNTPKDCAGCHATGTRVGATPKPLNHIPTTQPCDTCHESPTSFAVRSYKHIGISGGCSSCHNGQYLGVTGKTATHFSTLLPCETCHTSTVTFQSTRMNHTGLAGNCASCHSGQFVSVVSKPVAHIATTADCGACHNTTSFLGAVYDHGASPGVCSTCHSGAMPGVLGKPANHIATSAACDTCHTQSNTNNYSSFLGATYNHGATPGVCSTCHNGTYPGVLGKPSTHIPTTAACDLCHTQANTGNYSNFLGSSYNHVSPASAGVCATCHTGAYPNVSGKPAVHVATTASCDNCHTPTNTQNFTTFLGATYSHVGVVAGSCATCHNSVTATGKPALHIPTTAACDQCHTQANTGNYTNFLGAVYNHTNPPPAGLCSTCHNGTYPNVLGKSSYPSHVATTAQCDTCHTQAVTQNYTTFLGALYDHTGVTAGSCATCHDGVTAKGKPVIHITTAQSCDACHTQTISLNYTTFLGVTNPHKTTTVSGVCSTCHDGTQAVGKPASGHILTTAACDTCHTASNTSNYSTFLGATYSHAGVVAGSCATCHGGTYPGVVAKSAAHIPTSLACDACHTATNTSNYTTFLGVTNPHTTTPVLGVCSTCHNGTQATGKPATHVVTTAACDTCHANTAGYTTWLGAAYIHNVPAGVCSTCHNGTTATGKPATHVATTAACDTCHTNTAGYTTWLGATYVHLTPPGVCSTCHNGATATGKPANHIVTTLACDTAGCHTQTTTSNYTTFLGASGTDHTTVTLSSCPTCHNGTTAKGTSVGHIPTTGVSCSGCHQTYNGTTVLSFAPGTMGATQHGLMSATRCDVCHSGTYATQGVQLGGAVGKVTNHIPTTITAGLDCNTCHKNGFVNIAGSAGWATVIGQMNHNSAPGGGAGGVYCVNCHLTGVSYMGAMQKKSHNGASTAKDCSRSSCHKPLGSIGTTYSSWN